MDKFICKKIKTKSGKEMLKTIESDLEELDLDESTSNHRANKSTPTQSQCISIDCSEFNTNEANNASLIDTKAKVSSSNDSTIVSLLIKKASNLSARFE
jgi:hypothetical protein